MHGQRENAADRPEVVHGARQGLRLNGHQPVCQEATRRPEQPQAAQPSSLRHGLRWVPHERVSVADQPADLSGARNAAPAVPVLPPLAPNAPQAIPCRASQ